MDRNLYRKGELRLGTRRRRKSTYEVYAFDRYMCDIVTFSNVEARMTFLSENIMSNGDPYPIDSITTVNLGYEDERIDKR